MGLKRLFSKNATEKDLHAHGAIETSWGKNDEDFVSRARLATTCEVFTLLLQTRYLTSQRSGSEKWSEKERIMSQSSRVLRRGKHATLS